MYLIIGTNIIVIVDKNCITEYINWHESVSIPNILYWGEAVSVSASPHRGPGIESRHGHGCLWSSWSRNMGLRLKEDRTPKISEWVTENGSLAVVPVGQSPKQQGIIIRIVLYIFPVLYCTYSDNMFLVSFLVWFSANHTIRPNWFKL